MSFALGVTGVMLPELDLDEQLELMHELGLTHYSLRPRVISEAQRQQPFSNWGNHRFDLTPARLLKEAASLRVRLAEAGITPFGTVPAASVADDADLLQLHFEGAAAVGAGRVRVNPASYSKSVFDYEAALAETIKGYERAIPLAQRFGVKIVVETHAHSLATSPGLAWAIVRHFDPAEVGVIFDLPNFAREGGVQPVLAVSVLRKWIDHCHVGACRRVEVGRDAAGYRLVQDAMCPLADSDLHVPTWLATLRDAGLMPVLIIEDYTPGVSGADRLRDAVASLRAGLRAIQT